MVLSGTVLFAQNDRHNDHNNRNKDNTPQTVRESFNREHPDAANANWSQNNGQWHANYRDNTNNRNVESYYDNKGRHMYSRTEWNRKDLPGDYDKRIRSRYRTSNYRVTRIERPNNQPSLFELILNIGGRNKTVYTDERGNEVKFKLGF